MTADTDDANLENFFSRPVKVASYAWPLGSTFFQTFNPWSLFFENPRVINRITNYNLLRCKLKVKIILNGNSFYYGRAIASYNPLHNLDGFTKDRAFFIQDVVAASQRPHVYLDPTTSQGGTITLPFVWYENALRIPAQEWREMGEMHIHGMQNLKHANGATNGITVSVFVWAEEVSLSIPTANEPGALAPQMGMLDEYGVGPVSKPAGFIAKVAGALEAVPIIAPFAKATRMVSSTISGVASMFGYSRPTELSDIQPYKPTYLGNMANTNVPDTSTKLTLDAKQELTVDPRTFGLGGADEMSIKSIACRESYLTSFPWVVSAGAETLLWNSEVSPVTWTTNSTEIHMPACCFASVPFKHWRGTMKYRFQIVASAFHKGRLKISYDPSYPLSNEYNTNYTHIIDLAKERDFTLDVGWGHERSMVGHRDMSSATVPWSTSPLGADPLNSANGIISVYVVNELTVPNTTANNDIQINVFVSAGDDFEVFNPDSEIMENLVWFEPQLGQRSLCEATDTTLISTFSALGVSILGVLIAVLTRLHTKVSTSFDEISVHMKGIHSRIVPGDIIYESQMAEGEACHPDADLTKSENEPMKPAASEDIAVKLSPSDHTTDVYYGDPVTSFRQCLKRYCYFTTYSPDAFSAGDEVIGSLNSLSDFPVYRGYAFGAIHYTSVPTPGTRYNYTMMTLLNWVTPAFVCRRGGLRWKYLRYGGSNDDLMYVTRNEIPATTMQWSLYSALGLGSTFSAIAQQCQERFSDFWDGAHATHVGRNPVLEVELPYYNNIRFSPAKRKSPNVSAEPFRSEHHDLCMTWTLPDSGGLYGVHSFVSVGEDFNLGFFTGAPVCYVVAKGADPTPM
jgi:hypothetical protein